jgi:gamma-glutamylcyclotransferase (GGCT)/AIG2-like uncharacterized protein YtfP
VSDLLFVYGTLLPEVAPDSIAPVLRRVIRRGAATVSGGLFDLGEFPAMSLDVDGVVHGELVAVRAPGLWLRLDIYEGFSAAHPHKSLFRRQRCIVTRTDSDGGAIEQVDAWVYVYNRDLGKAPRIESGCWLSHLGEQPEVMAIPVA